MEENSHAEGFLNFVDEVSSVGIKSDITNDRRLFFQNLFEKEEFGQIIVEMQKDMKLETIISYEFCTDSDVISIMERSNLSSEILRMYKEYNIPFDRNREPATIKFSDPPYYWCTEEFKRHSFELRIGKTMKYESAESFISLLAHEFSHIVLHSVKHPLKHSEVATDICAIILGYGDIMRRGRILTGNSRLGYLTDQQFEIACGAVDEKKPGYIESEDKVSLFDMIKNGVHCFGNKFFFDKI